MRKIKRHQRDEEFQQKNNQNFVLEIYENLLKLAKLLSLAMSNTCPKPNSTDMRSQVGGGAETNAVAGVDVCTVGDQSLADVVVAPQRCTVQRRVINLLAYIIEIRIVKTGNTAAGHNATVRDGG